MISNLTRSALALAVALTSAPIAVSGASAQVELRIDRRGPEIRVGPDCDPRFDDCGPPPPRYRERYDDSARYDDRVGCDPERALWKAERMGIRRARVVDVGRRTIDVAGRDRRGERVIVTFGRRDRSCPVY